MKKKIREFLPETAIYLLGYSIALKLPPETMEAHYSEVTKILNGWLDTETEAEVDGVESKVIYQKAFDFNLNICGKCGEQIIATNAKFCHYCGTKIDWSEKNEFPAVL